MNFAIERKRRFTDEQVGGGDNQKFKSEQFTFLNAVE
jgi:hypothetical protein